MSARTPVLRRGRRSGILTRRSEALYGLALLLGILPACVSAPVDRSADQVRSGVTAADQGYWEEAEFRWRKALSRRDGDARALNNLAIRFEREGEFAQASDYYQRALAGASDAERFYIEDNWEQFEPILARIERGGVDEPGGEDDSGDAADDAGSDTFASTDGDGFDPASGTSAADGPPAPAGVASLEILVSVPDQGPNLAGYDRILIGNFAAAADSEANINDVAVRYFRRRITQRTFFETQDQIESPLPPELRDDLLGHREFWIERAAEVRADLVFTGHLGLNTSEESRMVRERIRSPDGQVREVARFQDSVVYKVTLDYLILRATDAETLLEGTLEAEQSFPADEGIADNEAVFEALEELLPEVLEAITPRRSEQSRYLIY